MNTKLPVWLLDVDGVVNACTKKPDRSVWPADEWQHHQAEAEGHTWPILTAKPVLQFIRDVAESGRAEVRWHTTWQGAALRLGDTLGLPRFDVAEAPEYLTWDRRRANGWWKRPAAERVLRDEGRPLVWTDDDITDALRGPGRDQVRALGPVLLVAPNRLTGLTRGHLRRISQYLDEFKPKPVGRFEPTPVMVQVVKVAAYQPGHHLPERTHARTLRGLVARGLAMEHAGTGCPCRWYVLTPAGLRLAADHGVTHTYEQEGPAA